jgi:hypothetical protein
MLTDADLEFVHQGTNGVALVWVIDEQCLYDLPLSVEHAFIFQEADEVLDTSEDYPDHDGITVEFRKNGETLETLQTGEYFGSILLSNPLVLDLHQYPYGLYVSSPDALFQNGEFVILDRDVAGEVPFYE